MIITDNKKLINADDIQRNSGKMKYDDYIKNRRDSLEKDSNYYVNEKSKKDNTSSTMDVSVAENTFNSVPHLKQTQSNNNSKDNTKSNQLNINSYAEFLEGNPQYSDYKRYFQKYHNGYEAAFNPAEKGITLIFITKPNLNIIPLEPSNLKENIKSLKESGTISSYGDSKLVVNTTSSNMRYEKSKLIYNSMYNGFFQWINCYYPDITKSLNFSINNGNDIPTFIPCLSAMFKTINIDDIATYEMTYGDTFKGYQERIPNTYAQSAAGGSINVTYMEDMNNTITKLHKLWFEYIELARFGYITPSANTLYNKELDYTSTLYFFNLEPDGHTINFWGRYLGIIPQSLPYSAFGSGVGERSLVELNCSYMYTLKQFMDPEILYDFNMIFQYNDGNAKAKSYVDGNTLLTQRDMNAKITYGDGIDNDIELSAEVFKNKYQYLEMVPGIEQSLIDKYNFSTKLNEEIPNYNRCAVYRINDKFKLHYYIK